MKTKIYFLMIALLLCNHGLTQPYYFKHYNNNSGLSHNTVMSIFQDSKSFIWIGTKNGLNRFDGHNFKIYQRGESVGELRNSMILCLNEDRQKNLWIGTDQGISLYNPYTELFSNFDPQTEKGIKIEGYIQKIFIDRVGRVYILASNGLFLFHPLKKQLEYLSDKLAIYTKEIPRTLYVDLEGTAYIGFPHAGIIKYNYEKNKAKILTQIPICHPTTMAEYKERYLLLGTQNNGLFRIDKENGEFEKLNIDPTRTSDIYVRDIKKISDSEYWLGTESGIYILKNGMTQHLVHEDFNDLTLSDNAVYSILQDKDGGIWIGSYFGGIDYLPKRHPDFETFCPIAYQNSVSGYRIREFVSDTLGNLYIATEDNGLNYYDTRSKRFTYLSEKTRPLSISFHNIQCLNLANDKLWIGTFSKGLDVINLKSNTLKHYDSNGHPNSLMNNDIFAIHTDSHNITWIGSSTQTYIYNPLKDNFKIFKPLDGYFISSILEDYNKHIWFTTFNGGVCRYNPSSQEIKWFKYDENNPYSLCYNRITCALEDSQRRLWFASEDGGFCRYNENDGTFTRITIKNGLPSNVIYKMLEDDNRRFWLSTNNGLVCFNPETMTVEALYGLSNGLQSKQFNYNSGIKMPDGRLYFGSINGFVVFNPKNLHLSRNHHNVILTGLYIFNQEVKAVGNKKILQQALPYADCIRLKYDQATFTIDFSALNYATEGTGTYAYKLDGIDKEWNYTDLNRISYNSIPPGDYTFLIKYSEDGHDWSGNETSMPIHIIPPIWRTGWAYFFYILLLMAILYLIIRSYLNRRKALMIQNWEQQEQEKKEEIYKAKIDFFTNIAHEIRTPLTLIKAPLDSILNGKSDEQEIKDNLYTMERNADRLLVLVNQLLDFRKIESKAFSLSLKVKDISSIVVSTYNRFLPMAKQRNLGMTMEIPPHAILTLVDEEALTKVCSNLFNNAIKYSSTYIKVILSESEDEQEFLITVNNDGATIPPNLRKHIFEAFFQIKDGNLSAQPGSGIGLTLARSLVQLHNGTLYLDEKSEDTSFVVQIPIRLPDNMTALSKDEMFKDEPMEKESLYHSKETVNVAKETILVVEDSIELQTFLQNQLGKHYKVLIANNGEEAMRILHGNIINIIVSDVMMPVMDGLELCKRIKQNLELCHIPVILLTAKATLNNRIEGLKNGADAYIEKPFSMSHLLVQVNNLLENRTKLRQNFANNPYIATNSMALNKADEDFLNKLTEYIRQNLDDENFNIDNLASEMNMSRTSLHRKIKGITELTPGDFIRIIRLKRAAELLLEGEYRINEICMLVGIHSLSYFSKSFQKQFGVLPKDFVKTRNKQTN